MLSVTIIFADPARTVFHRVDTDEVKYSNSYTKMFTEELQEKYPHQSICVAWYNMPLDCYDVVPRCNNFFLAQMNVRDFDTDRIVKVKRCYYKTL